MKGLNNEVVNEIFRNTLAMYRSGIMHEQKANNTIHSSVGYIEGQILKKAVKQNSTHTPYSKMMTY